MKLHVSTIEKLKNAACINKSIVIREGNKIRTMDDDESVFALATLEDSFPRQFGIHDLNQFLSAYSLMKDPDISFESDHISMKSEGANLKFFYANERHLPTPPGDNINLPKTLLSFTLEKSVLETMLKACSIMKITTLYMTGEYVECRNPDGDGNEYRPNISEIKVADDTNIEDKLFCLGIDSLKIIPNTYDVEVTPIAVRMTSHSGDVEYVVMLNSSN